ncbi:MAG: hypothetical protein E7172_03165 [Firmicutes bacterium]|nr:hypothetical protein [Bacillota bacterium]
MWTSRNKKYILFIIVLFICGIIGGLFFYQILNTELQNILKTSINNFFLNIKNVEINFFINHLLIMSFLIVSSFLIVGVFFNIIYIFYNGFIIGFIISIFSIVLGFKGFIFSIIYLIITKSIFLFFYLIFVLSSMKLSFSLIMIILKKNKCLSKYQSILVKRMIICFIIINIVDFILYFWGNYLLNIFNFLVL